MTIHDDDLYKLGWDGLAKLVRAMRARKCENCVHFGRATDYRGEPKSFGYCKHLLSGSTPGVGAVYDRDDDPVEAEVDAGFCCAHWTKRDGND